CLFQPGPVLAFYFKKTSGCPVKSNINPRSLNIFTIGACHSYPATRPQAYRNTATNGFQAAACLFLILLQSRHAEHPAFISIALQELPDQSAQGVNRLLRNFG